MHTKEADFVRPFLYPLGLVGVLSLLFCGMRWSGQKTPQALAALVALGLLACSAVYSPFWYDDVCHTLVLQQTAQHGAMAFPVEHRLGAPHSAQVAAASQFITVGPVLTYLAVPVQWALAPLVGPWYAVRVLMVLLALGALAALVRAFRGLFHPASTLWAAGLLLVNLQFLTYSTQFLGEVPAMTLWMAGLYVDLTARGHKRWWAILWWSLAVGVKASLLLPGGLYLFIMTFSRALPERREVRPWLFYPAAGVALLVGLALWDLLRLGNMSDTLAFWAHRSHYRAEFLAFTFSEPLRFLLLKPLFILGMMALGVRLWLSPRVVDQQLLVMQGALVFCFLGSAGYDRMGLWLLPIPALYLGEWLRTAWDRWGRLRVWRMALFGALFGLLFAQRMPLRFYEYLAGTQTLEQEALHCMAREVAQQAPTALFTAELAILPHLPAGLWVRLPLEPPVGAHTLPPYAPQMGEWLLAGPYAWSFYAPHLRPALRTLSAVAACPAPNQGGYALFRPPTRRWMVLQP